MLAGHRVCSGPGWPRLGILKPLGKEMRVRLGEQGKWEPECLLQQTRLACGQVPLKDTAWSGGTACLTRGEEHRPGSPAHMPAAWSCLRH